VHGTIYYIVHEAICAREYCTPDVCRNSSSIESERGLGCINFVANSPGFEANVGAAVLHFAHMFLVQ
jgi:hypothetical protein